MTDNHQPAVKGAPCQGIQSHGLHHLAYLCIATPETIRRHAVYIVVSVIDVGVDVDVAALNFGVEEGLCLVIQPFQTSTFDDDLAAYAVTDSNSNSNCRGEGQGVFHTLLICPFFVVFFSPSAFPSFRPGWARRRAAVLQGCTPFHSGDFYDKMLCLLQVTLGNMTLQTAYTKKFICQDDCCLVVDPEKPFGCTWNGGTSAEYAFDINQHTNM